MAGTTEPSIAEPSTSAPATSAPATTAVAATTTSSTTTPTSTTTVAPPTTIPGTVLALDVLALITVENEQQDGYDRDLFAYGDTVDGRGCRTRALVLIRDSLSPPRSIPSGVLSSLATGTPCTTA